MDKKKTGNLIKEARTRKKYTQSELGDLLGVTNKAVSRWENGESFPDIGILENLSEILEIKIQDIVVGEVQSNTEGVITEIVRLAKLQEKSRFREALYFLIGIIILLYSCLVGYAGLKNGGVFGNASGPVYMISLAVILMILVYGSTLQKENLMSAGNASKWLFIISAISAAWIILMISFAVIIVGNGVMPFNMKPSSVGPFLANQLIAVFLLNLVILSIEFYRIGRGSANIHLGVLISTSMLYLAALYGDMLHRLSTTEVIRQMLFLRTIIVVIAELLISIIIAFVLKRKNEQ